MWLEQLASKLRSLLPCGGDLEAGRKKKSFSRIWEQIFETLKNIGEKSWFWVDIVTKKTIHINYIYLSSHATFLLYLLGTIWCTYLPTWYTCVMKQL